MLPLLLMLAVQDTRSLVEAARVLTALETGCPAVRDSTDITVCGMRRADSFRVPFVVHDPGNPRYEAAPHVRERLLHHTNPVQDLSPFLVRGGMAGASIGVSDSGSVVPRPLAP